MKVINLLPESELKELKLELATRQLLSFFTVILISLVIIIVAIFAVRTFIHSQISLNNAIIVGLETQLNSSDNQALQKEIINLNSQIKNIKTLNQQHYYWSKALIELGNLSPQDLHLDFVTADRVSGKIVVLGTADKRDSVLTFWSNVKKSQVFQNINFPLTNLEKPNNTPFTFTFFVNPKSIQAKP